MSTIGKTFRLSAAVLGSLGLVVSVVENFRHLSVSLEENFWSVLLVSFVLSLAAAWPESSNEKPVGFKVAHESRVKSSIWKYRWIVAIILIFLAASYYRYHITNSKGTGERPVVKPGDIPLEPASSLSLIRSAYAYAPTQSPKLVSFTLRREKTLYIATERAGKKTYLLTREFDKFFRKGICTPEFDSGSALLALRAYAKQSNKQHILKYIESEEHLKSLVDNHPDIAKELMPTEIEWSKLSRTDYFAILNWVRNCVGIPFPVFIVTIENPSNRDLLITGINYNVLELERYPPTDSIPHPSGPLTPTATYTHKLVNKQGVQSYDITPPFRIPANSSGAFELQLHAKTEGSVSKLIFEMNIEFVTNQSSIRTDTFLLNIDKQ